MAIDPFPPDPPIDTVLHMEGKPSMWQGWDPSILDREGLMQEVSPGGDINFPWLIAISSTVGNAATVGMFFNPRKFEEEWGNEAVGVNQNWQGAGGQAAVSGGTGTIWW